MRISQPTRSFTFARVNPRPIDHSLLVDGSVRIDACLGYKTVTGGGEKRLVGFLVLRGPPAFPSKLCAHFPNFLIKRLDGRMDWDAVEEAFDSVHGDHPWKSIRKTLFP